MDCPPPPEDGPVVMKVKGKFMSPDCKVTTGEGQDWLFMDLKSGLFSMDDEFTYQLQTYKAPGQEEPIPLGTVEIGTPKYDIKAEEEFGDSDGSDYSLDDLFDGDPLEHEYKLKWKAQVQATCKDAEGNEFAKLKFKVKGKSKAEAVYEPNEDLEMVRTSLNCKTKVKSVKYHLTWEEQHDEGAEELDVEFDDGHWHDWDRTFETKAFEAKYNEKFGTDEVTCKVKEGVPAIKAFLVSFALAYYGHPSKYCDVMNSKAISQVS